MIIKKITALSLISFCVSSQANILPLPQVVYDPQNLAQNTLSAARSLQSYEQMVASYNQELQNLKALGNMKNLLANTSEVVNLTSGNSNYSLLKGLDPKSSAYKNQRDTILQQYYNKPKSSQQVRAELSGILPPQQIQDIIQEAERNQSNYERTTDSIDIAAAQHQAQKKRLEHIQKYKKEINQLGPTSSLKTAQTQAAQANLMLEQQEATIASLNAIQLAQQEQRAAQQSIVVQSFEAEQNRIQKASQQGSSGFGSDRWGTF